MANFKPLKSYLLRLLDEHIRTHRLMPPFLDVGTGQGDVAEHLARRGWHGAAVDLSPRAVETATRRLAAYPVTVTRGGPHVAPGYFRTALMFDVLEHEPDDAALLRSAYERLVPGGTLVIVVPTNPREWRWDDDFYGHLRRYRQQDLTRLLENAGFSVIQDWDCTYPFFWGLRRLYTALFPQRSSVSNSSRARTLTSSEESAWNAFRVVSAIAEHPLLWGPLTRFQHRFRNGQRGCERMILARRT